jgi:hypothetical protein
MNSEVTNLNLIRIEASKHGAILWRNNSGAMPDATGRWVRYGLANDSKLINSRVKSSDLIGITKNGRFLAIEVKKSGWRYTGTKAEVAQKRFLDLVNKKGGVAFFCDNSKKVVDMLNK